MQTLQAMHKAGCISLIDIVEGRFPPSLFFTEFDISLVFERLQVKGFNHWIYRILESTAYFFLIVPHYHGLALFGVFPGEVFSSQTEDSNMYPTSLSEHGF